MAKDDLPALVIGLNRLVQDFRFEEALEQYYSEEVVTVENENAPTIGLPAYRESARNFLARISNQSAKLVNVMISEEMSVTEWHYRFDHTEWGRWDCIQLSLQRWRDGKIVHERHHYNR